MPNISSYYYRLMSFPEAVGRQGPGLSVQRPGRIPNLPVWLKKTIESFIESLLSAGSYLTFSCTESSSPLHSARGRGRAARLDPCSVTGGGSPCSSRALSIHSPSALDSPGLVSSPAQGLSPHLPHRPGGGVGSTWLLMSTSPHSSGNVASVGQAEGDGPYVLPPTPRPTPMASLD